MFCDYDTAAVIPPTPWFPTKTLNKSSNTKSSPMASTSDKHLMERELSVEVFLNHIHPFRITRHAVQLLTQQTKAIYWMNHQTGQSESESENTNTEPALGMISVINKNK